MELRKRGDVWHVDLTDETGRRIRRTTGRSDKREAMKVAARLQQAVWDLQASGAGGKAATTLADATARYVASLTAQKKASADGQAALRKKALGIHEGLKGRYGLPPGLLLHDLTPTMLDTLVTARRSEGNGAQTIAHELKMLRAANRHAQELGYRAAEITRWRLPATPTKTRYLTLDEFNALVAYLDPEKGRTDHRAFRQDAQDLVVALGMTGGRWSEVAGLTWEQVDAPNFKVLRLWGNKVGKERLAPSTGALQKVLQRRWEVPGRDALRVFPRASGGLREGSCKPILRAMEALGFNTPENVQRYGRATVHSLRHTFASWLLQNGAGLAEVQDMLGHGNIQMTRRYAHLENATVASRMAEKLDGLMATPQG